jgi:quinol-cytochrome oxidoreductase complex cytochrome b subunit
VLRPDVTGSSRHRDRAAWFVGVLVLTATLIFAMTLYLLPPAAQ